MKICMRNLVFQYRGKIQIEDISEQSAEEK
jgi:hypothetical protein